MNTNIIIFKHADKSLGKLKYLLNRLSLVVILSLLMSNSAFAENRVYSVGIVPQFEVKRLHQIWRPIIDNLEQQTGFKFIIRGSANIPAFEREFMSGKFDFAYMNPYHIMLANDAEGYIPLTRDIGRHLQGVLVVRKDSGITKVEELNNSEIAFPSPNALGASLQIRQELTDKFHIDIKPEYVQTHDSVYLSVALRQSAAGGGVQATLNRQKPAIRDLLQVIHRTSKVSPHPFSVHPRVDVEVREKVRQAMLALGENEIGREMLAQIPVRQIGPASMQDYAPLKEMGLARFMTPEN
ncbi:MAG: phosphate/phosphite/phosphonate ABC transporter substrate-binding protein [Gammaproteobacteria bacterium]|nr:phosphate/phosphite/phosphonate ABC transporter substrate-binding protein [Gammaproteobacteria bacterium]